MKKAINQIKTLRADILNDRLTGFQTMALTLFIFLVVVTMMYITNTDFFQK